MSKMNALRLRVRKHTIPPHRMQFENFLVTKQNRSSARMNFILVLCTVYQAFWKVFTLFISAKIFFKGEHYLISYVITNVCLIIVIKLLLKLLRKVNSNVGYLSKNQEGLVMTSYIYVTTLVFLNYIYSTNRIENDLTIVIDIKTYSDFSVIIMRFTVTYVLSMYTTDLVFMILDYKVIIKWFKDHSLSKKLNKFKPPVDDSNVRKVNLITQMEAD